MGCGDFLYFWMIGYTVTLVFPEHVFKEMLCVDVFVLFISTKTFKHIDLIQH